MEQRGSAHISGRRARMALPAENGFESAARRTCGDPRTLLMAGVDETEPFVDRFVRYQTPCCYTACMRVSE